MSSEGLTAECFDIVDCDSQLSEDSCGSGGWCFSQSVFDRNDPIPRMRVIQCGCDVLQALLDQVSKNDAPPVNDNLFRRRASIHALRARSPQCHAAVIGPGTHPADQWTAHYHNQLQMNPGERRLGNVSLAALCARTLETIGRPHKSTGTVSEPTSGGTASRMGKPSTPSKWKWLRSKKRTSWGAKSTQDDRVTNASSSESSSEGASSESNARLQMFGSEYARYLSTTALGPAGGREKTKSKNRVKCKSSATPSSRRVPLLEEADSSVLTGAVTDIMLTFGDESPPRGFYRISQSGNGELLSMYSDAKTPVYVNVKKESNWDRAAQRPCVTAVAIIFPDRKEFVPPGFSVARRHARIPDPKPASMRVGGEPVHLCFRRSREGNPVTGIVPLLSANRENVPEGYTVLERSPRNHAANVGTDTRPIFLAIRQRLANLEPLRPLPLVIHVHTSSSAGDAKLRSYYCTGGTVVESDVGKFHIMDRSTHSLLSPSSVSNRLSLIKASRQKSLGSANDLNESTRYTSSAKKKTPRRGSLDLFTSSLLFSTSIGTPSVKSERSTEVKPSICDSDSVASSSASDLMPMPSSPLHTRRSCTETMHSPEILSNMSDEESVSSQFVPSSPIGTTSPTTMADDDDSDMRRCLEALSFIPVVSSSEEHCNDPRTMLLFQARVAVVTPILTACYTHHGRSSLVAVEGLIALLYDGFFEKDMDMQPDSLNKLTLLDLAIQVVCDVATTGVQETIMNACVEFVEAAIKYATGYLNTRTVAYSLRFYLFVYFFGASAPRRSDDLLQWGEDKKAKNAHILDDPRTPYSLYLPGGAPQMAALALKELITLSIRRLRRSRAPMLEEPPTHFASFIDGLVEKVIDDAVYRVDVANYTQMAAHQIHRSGGSELFWHDMMNCCGKGLFENDLALKDEERTLYILCFSILANLVKVASYKIRKSKDSVPVPRDVAGKLLSLEILHHFLIEWGDDEQENDETSRSVETFSFCIRRLIVPCMLSLTKECLEDVRVFQRVIDIIGVLWGSRICRVHMKLELGVLLEHFVLKILLLGPQLRHKPVEVKGLGSVPFLLDHQIAVICAVKSWFSHDPSDVLELYANFDDEPTTTVGAAPEILNGVQWKICQQLSAAICSIAEMCGDNIGVQIQRSTSMPSSTTKDTDLLPKHKITEEEIAAIRDNGGKIRKVALRSATQLIKSLTELVMTACGPDFQSMLYSWSGTNMLTAMSNDIMNGNQDGDDRSFDSVSSAGINDVMRDLALEGYYDYGHIPEPTVTSAPSSTDSEASDPADFYEDMELVVYNPETQPSGTEHLEIALEIAREKNVSKAIDYLLACNVLTASPRDVASFLWIHRTELTPAGLGDYIGEGGTATLEVEYWNSIRYNFIRAVSFVDMSIEQGLRHLLTNCGFRLPGEAQQIDRIMTTFAQCFWEDNAGHVECCPFPDQDTVFMISFAVIMLNTDLHKIRNVHPPNTRKKMSKAEFMNNLRGVLQAEDFPRDYLSDIYDSIEDSAIILNHDERGEANEYSLASRVSAMINEVKSADAFLRGLSVHEHRYMSSDDLGPLEPGSPSAKVLRECVVSIWHHYYGLINTALEIAHLDLQGMDWCIQILKYSLVLTICLDMPVERSAFLGQLGRLHMFNVWRQGKVIGYSSTSHPNDGYMCEDWFQHLSFLSSSRSARAKLNALSLIHFHLSELGTSLAVDAKDQRTMIDVVRQLKNGKHLLNNPTRTFWRQGDMVKRANRSGRSVVYRFFLFSDVLLYAKLSGQDQYKIHEELPLIYMKIVDWFPPEQRKESKLAFQVYHPRKKFMVFCSSTEERASWVASIREAIRTELKRKVAIEAARVAAGQPQY